MSYDVFISYSRHDEVFVERLTAQLDALGYSYWIDTTGIESGDVFKKNIVKAIKASRVVLFVSSRHSNESTWTTREINYAIHNGKPIIPIRVDGADYNEVLQFDLEILDYVDCTRMSRYAEGFERLGRALLQYFPERAEEATSSSRRWRLSRRMRRVLIVLACVLGIGLCVGGVGYAVYRYVVSDHSDEVDVFVYAYDWQTMTARLDVVLYTPDLTEAVIPSSVEYENREFRVTGIGPSAFDACPFLTRVTIPETVTSIGERAFRNCSSLTEVVIPGTVTSIGQDAFPEACRVTYPGGGRVDLAALHKAVTEDITSFCLYSDLLTEPRDTFFLSNPGRHIDLRIDTLGRFYIYNGTIHDLIYDLGDRSFDEMNFLPTSDGHNAIPVCLHHAYVLKWLRYSEKYRFEYGDGYYYMKLRVDSLSTDEQGRPTAASIRWCSWDPSR